ncbi:BspA family leucine-rich repeat surface protein [Flagellimonas nanhaiensis]|nr:BspA family leucine-rich repeat surface protein [Allomuricauda nanhaiensis]
MKLRNLLVPVTLLILMVFSCGKDDDATTNTEPEIAAQSFNVKENLSDTDPIGTVKATDGDGDKLTFSITTNDNNLFAISDNGILTLTSGKSLDYATATSHTIIVSVSDGTDSAKATMTINVTEVAAANQAPIIATQEFEVAEDLESNLYIDTVIASDPDGDILTFAIVTNDNDLFELTSEGDLRLADGKSLDYETATSHQITVRASDGTDSAEAIITIKVSNVVDAPLAKEVTSFVLTFETTEANEIVIIGTDGGLVYDYTIDWGDGTVETITTGVSPSHEFTSPGTHTIAINGKFPRIIMSQSPSAAKLMSIEQWGAIEWESFALAFQSCQNMMYNATDVPDLSLVMDLTAMFYNATSFNGNLSNWDVSTIKKMRNMFAYASSFNGDISDWKVDNVETMFGMFAYATEFNQDLGGWNIGNVQEMNSMLDASGLSPENYAKTIIGWAGQENVPSNITFGMDLMGHCDVEAFEAQTFLENEKGWTFDGQDNSC